MIRSEIAVVGGSAAGGAAAITAAQHNPGKRVLVVRREEKTLIPCGIPYIFGTLGDTQKNLIPDEVLTSNGVDLRIDEVRSIEAIRNEIQLASGETLSYERLILAIGSRPTIPQIPGVNLKNVFSVRKDVDHLDALKAQLDEARSMVVIGGGFIGVEFADECRKGRDLSISVVEMLPHCLMATYDTDFCAEAECIEQQEGVRVIAPAKVTAILGDEAVQEVELDTGERLPADVVLLGIGAKANTELAAHAGLRIGRTGCVDVNRYMQTSDPNIFSCGDCVEKRSFFDGLPCDVRLASEACKEGRIAGANLYGLRRANKGVLGVYSTVIGDTAFARAGLTVREAHEKGFQVAVGESAAPNRHPGCMPGGKPIKVRLVFERALGTLLGGQVMGARSAGELINVVSACIHQRMTADEIAVFPMGTHPALTASPLVYQLATAAEAAICEQLG